jgi:hypothetical protein
VADGGVTKWEYITTSINLSLERPDAVLNKYGAQGWELVAVAVDSHASDLLIFKRRIVERETNG